MYRLKDLQIPGKHFAEGATFKTLQDVRDQLVSYHNDLEKVETMSLDDLLEVGGWQIEEVD